MDRLPPAVNIARPPELRDTFGRSITYLRVSVTDRCNLRCQYCMGRDVEFLPKAEVLSLEEIERVCAAFIGLGVRKLRLTGGEPLLRRGVVDMIGRLGGYLRGDAAPLDELTLTTNGTLLARHAAALYAAGVRRVNVSLDTLDEATFLSITQRGGLSGVLAGIAAARSAGLAVRANAVALAGINDTGFDKLIAWCGEHGCDLALIEMMPLGARREANELALDGVRRALAERWTLTPSAPETRNGGPCRYWNIAETGQRVGFITPLSEGFCSACNRVRLNATGRLVTCMAQPDSVDLRAVLRDARCTDDELRAAIVAAVAAKPEGHRFNTVGVVAQRMWQLGG